MHYENVSPARFLDRPNRFIAHCEVEGKTEICHVKNTGRCKEILLPGAKVYVQKSSNPNRKTQYDLIAACKGEQLINIDSQAPNPVFREWASAGGIDGLTLLRPEVRHGNSRFDFYLEAKGMRTFVEVKGCTLEHGGICMFPDAPTDRGLKHVQELIHCLHEGYGAMIVFIIQMQGMRFFTPNDQTHPAFGQALREARKAGVQILALDCLVQPDCLTPGLPVEIRL